MARRVTIIVEWPELKLTEEELTTVGDYYCKSAKAKSADVQQSGKNQVTVAVLIDSDDDSDCLQRVLNATPSAFFTVGPPAIPADIKAVAIEKV